MGQMQETAPDIGVVMGRPLAPQIGHKDRAAGGLQRAQIRGERPRVLVQNTGQPIQRIRGRQDHPHLVPQIRQRVAKAVQRAFRCRGIARRRGKQHARGAKRDERLTRFHHTHPDGRGGIIAAAPRNGDPRR